MHKTTRSTKDDGALSVPDLQQTRDAPQNSQLNSSEVEPY